MLLPRQTTTTQLETVNNNLEAVMSKKGSNRKEELITA